MNSIVLDTIIYFFKAIRSEIRMITDEHLAGYIDSIFSHYDRDNSGGLDARELTAFFNDLYRAMGNNQTVTVEQSQQALGAIDRNNDGRINKGELFQAFKGVLTREGLYMNGQQMYSNSGQSYDEAMQMWRIARENGQKLPYLGQYPVHMYGQQYGQTPQQWQPQQPLQPQQQTYNQHWQDPMSHIQNQYRLDQQIQGQFGQYGQGQTHQNQWAPQQQQQWASQQQQALLQQQMQLQQLYQQWGTQYQMQQQQRKKLQEDIRRMEQQMNLQRSQLFNQLQQQNNMVQQQYNQQQSGQNHQMGGMNQYGNQYQMNPQQQGGYSQQNPPNYQHYH